MAEGYDVIVVGGGIVGASAAYHLVKNGIKTLLFDRRDTGRATDAGAGILAPEMNRRDPEPWVEFAVEAVGYYPGLTAALAEEGAGDTSFAQCGMLLVAATEDEIAPFEESKAHILARAARRGTPSEAELHPVSPKEARELFPALSDVHGALYFAGGARVDGAKMGQALLTAAQHRGLNVREESVTGLVVDGERVRGVRVGEDVIEADKTIIAGGAWSATFGDQLGVTIPVEPQRGQIAHLELPATRTADWPIIGAFRGHYIVPWEDGRVAIGATRETGSGYKTDTTAVGIREVLDEGLRVASGLAPARLLEVRVGLRPLPPDGLPVMGTVPGLEGVLLATGHGPTGLQLGPYSGKVVADMMQGAAAPTLIEPFSVARF